MENLRGPLVAALAVAGGVVALGFVLRVAIVRPLGKWRRRTRLRRPDAEGVAGVCGFRPPPELLEFYAHMPFVDRVQIELVDPHEPSTRWAIGAFVPLRKGAVRQARAAHGVGDGIPIADDGKGGAYVLVQGGAVVLRSRAVPGGEARVASHAGALLGFEAVWPVWPLLAGIEAEPT